MFYGKIRWFKVTEGYGSIIVNGNRKVSVRFMATDVNNGKIPKKDDSVSFEVKENTSGEEAKNVTILS